MPWIRFTHLPVPPHHLEKAVSSARLASLHTPLIHRDVPRQIQGSSSDRGPAVSDEVHLNDRVSVLRSHATSRVSLTLSIREGGRSSTEGRRDLQTQIHPINTHREKACHPYTRTGRQAALSSVVLLFSPPKHGGKHRFFHFLGSHVTMTWLTGAGGPAAG